MTGGAAGGVGEGASAVAGAREAGHEADVDSEQLAAAHRLGDREIPRVVLELARGTPPELVWRNDLGGLTFRIGERFVKWSPLSTGIDLGRERVRLDWLAPRHPAPRVIGHGTDDAAQWLVTAALPGEHAVGDRWRARRDEAIAAIATGLRAIHAVSVADVGEWATQSWPHARPDGVGDGPPVDDPVLVHGDACAPNTLVDDDGTWTGHVDVGDLCVGDRWADLAIASLSLDWNFGEGHQDAFFAAYGVDRDEDRIEWYRALWHAAS